MDIGKCLTYPVYISRADLAHFMLSILDDVNTFNQIVSVAH